MAVVNEDGLWIKEQSLDGNKIFIINAKTYKVNILENLKITQLDKNYKLLNTIVSDRAIIEKKEWFLTDVRIYSENKKTESYYNYTYNSSFNEEIISNLYSNLNSLNILSNHFLSLKSPSLK